jgi:hypothetical protein
VIYDLVLQGHSLRNIAEYLTNQGVPTTSGKIWHEAFLARLRDTCVFAQIWGHPTVNCQRLTAEG